MDEVVDMSNGQIDKKMFDKVCSTSNTSTPVRTRSKLLGNITNFFSSAFSSSRDEGNSSTKNVSELVEKREKVSEEENLTVVATPDLGESQTRHFHIFLHRLIFFCPKVYILSFFPPLLSLK